MNYFKLPSICQHFKFSLSRAFSYKSQFQLNFNSYQTHELSQNVWSSDVLRGNIKREHLPEMGYQKEKKEI